VAVANTISDDLYHGLLSRGASPARRLFVARLSMLLTATVIFSMSQGQALDPLRSVISAFSLSAGTFFPVLVLCVWWKRLTGKGALAGMATGFAVTALYLSSGGTPLFGIDPLTAAAIGVPAGFAAAILASLLFGSPDEQALDAADELRIPAGETLQSRMLRLAARAKPLRQP
jgi:cation/acetate symporter